jgi:hypothetical protein
MTLHDARRLAAEHLAGALEAPYPSLRLRAARAIARYAVESTEPPAFDSTAWQYDERLARAFCTAAGEPWTATTAVVCRHLARVSCHLYGAELKAGVKVSEAAVIRAIVVAATDVSGRSTLTRALLRDNELEA